MPTPFPAMDPYLERPGLWPDVHNRLLVLIAEQLTPLLRPRYYAAAEPTIDLTLLLDALYDRAGYDMRIDYRAEPEPPMAGDDAAWADALLRAAGLRS